MKSKVDLFKLTEKETQETKAGIWGSCRCGCAYVNCGGSSTLDNYDANFEGGLISPHFTPQC